MAVQQHGTRRVVLPVDYGSIASRDRLRLSYVGRNQDGVQHAQGVGEIRAFGRRRSEVTGRCTFARKIPFPTFGATRIPKACRSTPPDSTFGVPHGCLRLRASAAQHLLVGSRGSFRPENGARGAKLSFGRVRRCFAKMLRCVAVDEGSCRPTPVMDEL
ncbi:uncharacterized protein PSANT_00872 [Moesziomyces antarcticus]|uniref:Uncharacterized protein n=1 Tax=Pseudozyma antarctica TaxID=84753 RepID=A0A5C3FFS6_PSEA2|nr:uncharacterized protein PSANT_00872 [Moesziomyces antarcticus]